MGPHFPWRFVSNSCFSCWMFFGIKIKLPLCLIPGLTGKINMTEEFIRLKWGEWNSLCTKYGCCKRLFRWASNLSIIQIIQIFFLFYSHPANIWGSSGATWWPHFENTLVQLIIWGKIIFLSVSYCLHSSAWPGVSAFSWSRTRHRTRFCPGQEVENL